jgi:hypothetical protein
MSFACLLLALGLSSPVWAGPFSEIPAGHWAYGACARLVELGWLPAERPDAFSGKPQLTRFEFGLAILSPLGEIDRAFSSLPGRPDAKTLLRALARALHWTPLGSEDDMARGAADLARLSSEFSDILHAMGFDPARAETALKAADARGVREWRSQALALPTGTRALTAAQPPTDTLRVPIGHGAVALSYDRDPGPLGLLDYFAASVVERVASSEGLGLAEPALRDPFTSRLRTAYEYGLGSAVTLSLAYEEIARRGQGLAPLDAASLASFGIGYRLTPSTSVKLSYSLSKYSNYALEAPPLRDRVAETAVSIGF